MLTPEVVYLKKKLLLSSAALLLLLLSNLNICCRLSVDGRMLEGLYSPFDADRCISAAAAAAEEILPGHAAAVPVKKHYRLSFLPPAGGLRLATGSILRSYSGIALEDGVYVNGVFLGVVEDGDALKEKLRDFIKNQMPNRAVFGSISGKLEIKPVYTREGRYTDDGDMLLLISGVAPVIYVDSEGRLA